MDRITTVAFFDIGDTLASVTLAPSGNRIGGLTAYSYVPGVLAELRQHEVRLGILSHRGPIPAQEVNRALESAGLLEFFEPDLVIYARKDSPQVFADAAARAGGPARTLFVGEDPGERSHALGAGYLVAPHPLLALPVLEEQGALRYIRITVPAAHAGTEWASALRGLPVVPLHITGPEGRTIYATATTQAAARLDDLGFGVDRLGAQGLPSATGLYLLRDDDQARTGFLAPDGNSTRFFQTGRPASDVLASTADGLLMALSADESIENYHFRGTRHGHNLKLLPITEPADGDEHGTGLLAVAPSPATIDAVEREILDAVVQPVRIGEHVDRYTGAAITSRHIHHAGNTAAVTTLVEDLERIGESRLTVRRHRFSHEGRRLDNIEAELPGSGLDGIVLVSAHMDSTGARQTGYQPATDPAPGADDDASGVAGVLAAAEAIAALDTALHPRRRTVRFVLFNAEEHGLVGSAAYARDQADAGAPIVAVLQMDMIGYDVLPDRTFELHAGFTPSTAIEARSLTLARAVAALVPQVSAALPSAQLYPVTGEPDPAERRSDHYSFQRRGYPACLASEDLFAGPGPNAPPEEMNPQYHMPTDKVINTGYAADIARVVTAAAWIAATR
jgi:leucyl aminopeptidase